jgi:hypothetical protein
LGPPTFYVTVLRVALMTNIKMVFRSFLHLLQGPMV